MNGFEYAPGSSTVTLISMWPMSLRVQRSMVCSCSVCGCPRRSNQNLSLKPTVSMTSVSPSNEPMEWPNQRRIQLRGMLAAVHEDLPEAVDVPFVELEDVRRRLVRVVLDEAPRVRLATHDTLRHAVEIRVVGLLARIAQRLGRREDRHLARLQPAVTLHVAHGGAADPEPVEVDLPVRQARRRPARRRRTTDALAEGIDLAEADPECCRPAPAAAVSRQETIKRTKSFLTIPLRKE